MRKPLAVRKAPAPAAPVAVTTPHTIASDALLRGAREVHITHRGKRYRLLETRAGKLLLNT